MTDRSEWEVVGQAIEQRMSELGLTKAQMLRAAGLSDKTLKGYLEGRPIRRADKAAAITSALHWPPEALDRILRGEPPMAGQRDGESDAVARAEAQYRDAAAAVTAEEARLAQLAMQLRAIETSVAQAQARLEVLRDEELRLRARLEIAVRSAEEAKAIEQRPGDPYLAPRSVLVDLLLELMPQAELTRLLKARITARAEADSTTVEPADENFAVAAEKGERDTKQGRKARRPSPPPEPEGP